MVSIEAGSFLMGSPDDESGRDSDEGPQRTVSISAFQMSETEITQRQWEDVMGWNESGFAGENLPVEGVTWYDCLSFCNKLSEAEGLTPCYTMWNEYCSEDHIISAEVTCDFGAGGYRLPTEAEWEYACRALTTTRYYVGDLDSDLDPAAWYSSNSSSTTHVVGAKEANAWGLYDMHGNVWEWCWDTYVSDYYSTRPDPDADPHGPDDDSLQRAVRGGSWKSSARLCRSADRYSVGANQLRANDLGFRVVR